MEKGLLYNDIGLKQLLNGTNLSHAEIAQRVGVKRNQIYKAVNGRGASASLIQRLVALANEIAAQREIYAPAADWRDLLLTEPAPAKSLRELVS